MDQSMSLTIDQMPNRQSQPRWVRPGRSTIGVHSSLPFGTVFTAFSIVMVAAVGAAVGAAQFEQTINQFGLRSGAWSWLDITGYGRVVTYAFLHADTHHLIWNTTLLLLIGSVIEWRLGVRAFGLLVVAGIIAAGTTHLLTFPIEMRPLIGSSGAVAALFGAVVIVDGDIGLQLRLPNTSRWLNLSLRRLLLFWFVVQLFGIALVVVSSSTPLGVAYWSHIAGFIVGIAGGLLYQRTMAAKSSEESPPPVLEPGFSSAGD